MTYFGAIRSLRGVTTTIAALLTGFFTGLSLIAAIGAQNAFILKQGIARQQVPLIVTVCVLSDIILIAAGVAGVGAVVQAAPEIIHIATWLGVAFLAWYGISALRRAFRREPLAIDQTVTTTRRGTLLTCLALTWLNPHVYLDTVLLIGSIAAAQGDQKWACGCGAMLASVLWFAALGWGSQFLAPLFTKPAAARILEGTVGATMLVIGARLLAAF